MNLLNDPHNTAVFILEYFTIVKQFVTDFNFYMCGMLYAHFLRSLLYWIMLFVINLIFWFILLLIATFLYIHAVHLSEYITNVIFCIHRF